MVLFGDKATYSDELFIMPGKIPREPNDKELTFTSLAFIITLPVPGESKTNLTSDLSVGKIFSLVLSSVLPQAFATSIMAAKYIICLNSFITFF